MAATALASKASEKIAANGQLNDVRFLELSVWMRAFLDLRNGYSHVYIYIYIYTYMYTYIMYVYLEVHTSACIRARISHVHDVPHANASCSTTTTKSGVNLSTCTL